MMIKISIGSPDRRWGWVAVSLRRPLKSLSTHRSVQQVSFDTAGHRLHLSLVRNCGEWHRAPIGRVDLRVA